MRRSFARAYGTVAVALPLLVVATAIVQAEGATPAPQAAAAPAAEKKKLNTVPEDGIPGADLLVPNKLVRDFMAKRPNEDLIVCVAGCYSHRDKVVYAQPMEPKTPAPTPPVAEAAPAAAPPVAEANPSLPAATPEKVIDNAAAKADGTAAAVPTVINAAPPAAAETSAPPKDADVRSQMLPTMSEPEGEAAPAAPSEEPAASDSDVPPESRDSER
jgi:hypothetical protein